ncbi:PREDICTED: organic solute transporter subunit alpha-like [Corvus brachyrhynchos]|uniref:organic solute transporter subunit alpha-like n=1 Tax=Corvus brachyrhynchos TaxID=85066 RepID=UPI0008167EDD|nr:PREDICTED: organic solute transporter subunit alpha-like [Corvus brachyrhynchos]
MTGARKACALIPTATSHQSGFGKFHICSVPWFIPLSVKLGPFWSSKVMANRRCLKDRAGIFVDCKAWAVKTLYRRWHWLVQACKRHTHKFKLEFSFSLRFFAIVIHKFLMMMIKECGGQKMLLRRFENGRFTISTGPCCCCCLCLPRVPITRQTLFWLKLSTFQFAVFRPMLIFLSIVLWTNGNYVLYNLSPKGPALWISCFIGALTLFALWAVGIMFRKVRILLKCKNIIPKFALYQFIVILNQLQTTIINIFATQKIIPCAPPLSSTARGSYIAQQLLIMEMFLITVISRVVYRRKYHDLEPLECAAEEPGEKKQPPKIILNGAVVEEGLPKV